MFKKEYLSGVIVLSLVMTLGLSGVFTVFEPGLSYAATSVTDSVVVTLTVTAGVTITSPADAVMNNAIDMNSNTSYASSTWNVKTNNYAGYNLTVQATSTPAMQASSTAWIADSTTTPVTWGPGASNALGTATSTFAFAPRGVDVVAAFNGTGQTTYDGTGAACGTTGTGAPHTTLKYRGFTGATAIQVATKSATTTTSGVDTTVCYAAGQNGVYIPSGAYNATITATAVTL